MTVRLDSAVTLPPVRFGLARLEQTLQRSGFELRVAYGASERAAADIQILAGGAAADLAGGGFRITMEERTAGPLRGGGGLDAVKERTVEPHLPFRAIKFNLPWSPYLARGAQAPRTGSVRGMPRP